MTAGTAATILLQRYRVTRTLKDGHTVRTFLADDLVDGGQVVVKAAEVTKLLPGARLRLEHEVAVLRRLDSTHVAAFMDFGRDGDLVCLVTAFVGGATLTERLADGSLGVAETLAVARCLLEALRDAHEQGVLHRDVKPSNIVLGPASADSGEGAGRAVLIDFGLARTGWLDPAVRDVPAGTVRYMSPEQAGLIERDLDERSDLYSAGAVLFECLAGVPLFDGATLGEVLRRHLAAAVPRLAQMRSDVPGAVEAFLARLLAPDPDDRYSSAEAALVDLADIAGALSRGEVEPRVVVGARDRRRRLAEPAFVGRGSEMDGLLHAVVGARAGRADLVLVEAESGGGKSRLLEEFAARSAREDLFTVRGQGVDQAAQRPLEVLVGVAAQVRARAQADPVFAQGLRAQLADRGDALCAALPDLAAILGPDAATPGEVPGEPASGVDALGPEAFGETRTVEAITALLHAIGSEKRPAVVLLDDGQWADELSLKVLLHWQQRAVESGRHTVIVVAFRSEEVDYAHPLRRLGGSATRIALLPLGAHEVTELAQSMAGPLPAEATEVLIRLSGGTPFMTAAVLRGLVETGALAREADGWRADPAALAEACASQRAAAFLSRRIALLPEPTRALLSVGAVLGKEFDPELCADLAGQEAAEAFAGLREAARRHIVWIRADRCAFVHDKLRETLLGMLDPAERQRLHRAAAERLEVADPGRDFELAFHFDAAGECSRALPYALAAAGRARARHALQAAQQQYEIAERGARGALPSVRLTIAEGLGDVLMLRGLYDAAEATYAVARDLASERITIARVQGKLGELAFKRGDVRTASTSLENALRSLGHRVPTSNLGFALGAARGLLTQVLHTLLPRFFVGRRRAEDTTADTFVAIRLLSRITHAYWFARGSLPTLWAHLRELNLAERYPPSAELAQAYSEHAPVMTLIPLFGRGQRYGERSLAIRRDLGDLWGQGQSLNFIGAVHYSASRFEECIARAREGVRLLERTGDRWEVHTARWHIAFSLYRLGDLRGAVDMARSVYQSGADIGDAQARGIAIGAWSKASGGRVPKDLVAAELARPCHDVHTSAEVLQAEAVRRLAEDDPAGAVEALERARALVRAAGLRQEYVAPIWPWLATALRVQLESTPSLAHRRRRALLRQAWTAARRAVRLARSYRNNLPHALREAGLIAAARGRPRRAHRLCDRSVAVACELGMSHEHAQSLQARARIGLECGWLGAAEDLAAARALLAERELDPGKPEAVTPSLVDRFDTILQAGHRIATALTRDAVYAAVQEAAATLLRGERCLVLEVADAAGGGLIPVAGHTTGEFSHALAHRALAEGRTVILDEQTATDASDSVVLAGLRSVLCAPLLSHGKPVACLYTEHRRVGGLFGADSARLAGFIATLAGAALENAEGFAKVQELTRTLERRVAERTAELSDAYDREQEISAQLRRLDQLKTEFMAMAAHDLRTPITVIGGFAATLRDCWDDIPDAERRDYAGRIAANTQRLSEFVDNLLQFARIQSGELSYETRTFDLGALVQRTAAEQAATEGRNRLCVDLPPGLPQVAGDEQRYWQVLTNLFANAAKFSPPDAPVEVAVRARGEMIEVSVRDHGPGIDPVDRPKLFQRFSRLDGDGTYTRPTGTGLGLYICRSIVEAQGGQITVQSTPGHGATFTFTVPLAEPPAPRIAAQRHPESALPAAHISRR